MEPNPDFSGPSRAVRKRQREERWKRRIAFARETALATIPQALGTIVGGIVLILLARAFGLVTSLDGRDVTVLLAILTALLGAGTAAITLADQRDQARTEAAFREAYALAVQLSKDRAAEIDELLRDESEPPPQ